jgi:hypothetical protein
MNEEVVRKPRGRPRKDTTIEREPKRESAPSLKMRAKPNWQEIDPSQEDLPDKLHIKAEMIPPGMSALWVTESVFGQPQPQRRATFERKGWTPVHQEDFDGQFDGVFMPKGDDGEIKVDGLVLMMRPKELTDKARLREERAAREQVVIKEQALRGGDLPVSLDATHPSAVGFNKIKKTVERIVAPDE